MKKLIQTLPTVMLGVLVMGLHAAEPGVGEVSGFAGFVSVRDGGATHGNYGGTVGRNLGRFVHLFGEVSYLGVGKENFVGTNTTVRAIATGSGYVMNYGGGAQIRIPTGSSRVEPYGLLSLGYGRMNGGGNLGRSSANSNSVHSAYNGVGGGARLFIGRNWGVKPEFRYQKYYGINVNSDDPVTNRGHVITTTAGVFYRFGGR